METQVTSQKAYRAYLTPPTVGRLLGVRATKIISWIRSGEISAVDLSTTLGGRPRWRISQESLAAFLAARSNRPAAKPVRRRRQMAVMEFFP